MPDRYTNKVQLADGTVLIDLTADTVDAGQMLSGYTAHKGDGSQITGTIPSGAGVTYTPTRTQTVLIQSGTYLTGNVIIEAIPANYYTLAEVFPVGSLYATESSTDNPATILGFGTWTKYAPAALTWGDANNMTWGGVTGVRNNVYVWKRTA